MKTILNRLFSRKHEMDFIIQISKWFSEHIKSHMRKTDRYEINMYQLRLLIQKEFNQILTNKQLITLIDEIRIDLYKHHIAIYADSTKLIAGFPLKYAAN